MDTVNEGGAVHGGDLDYAVRRYGLKREEIKDFSGNINPFGISEKAKQAVINNIDMVSTYPDANYLSLRSAIAKYVNADLGNVIVGNGGTELISLFVRASGCKNALIVAPVYSEYEREIKLHGGECRYYVLMEEASFNTDIDDLYACLTSDIDLLAICNPNNPTGTALKREEMDFIAEECERKGIKLLIDETYCEFSDESIYSSIPLVKKHDNMIVIRGVSKFFASPGLRLGYAVCGNGALDEINRIRDPWSVNSLAAVAAEGFFSDIEYISMTKNFIQKERARIKKELLKWKPVRYYETVTNFQLFKLLRNEISSAEIFEKLIVKGMMIRDASSFKFLDNTFIRFCTLNKEDNDALLNELSEILNI